MAEQETIDNDTYQVVVNHEEQYSIWPQDRDCPPGWRSAGKTGSKAECLAYIEEVWTDMRPLSLRREMEQRAQASALPQAAIAPRMSDPRDDLVTYLCQGNHPVRVSARSTSEFLERIKSGYVNIRFTDTRGGTELGIKLDATAMGTTTGVQGHAGQAHLAGDLTLNYRQVRLNADVALDTLEGYGRLELR